MQTVILGDHEPTVSALGLVTEAWRGSLFWAYGKDFRAQEVTEAFRASLAAGITLFNTAEIYGLGESKRLLGQFSQKNQLLFKLLPIIFPYPSGGTEPRTAKQISSRSPMP